MLSVGIMCSVLTAICWAIGPVFLRKSLDTFDNAELNAARSVSHVAITALACVIFNPTLLAWKYGLNMLGIVFIIVLFSNVIGDMCYFVAIDNIGVGRALSTCNSYPIFISLLSVFLLGETPSVTLWIGTIIIVAGLAFLNCSKKNPLPASQKARNNKLGFFMAIVAAVLWAMSLSMQKWILTRYNVEVLSLVFWRAVLLSLTSWGIWYSRKKKEERKHIFNVGFRKWFSPIIAGAFSLALGNIAFAQACVNIPVSLASPISATNPVLAAIMAKFAFNERLSFIQWGGVLLVIIGGVEVSL